MGDFGANFHRPESGIHTVEGNLAGNRAALLTKKRKTQQEEFEARKHALRAEKEKSAQHISHKFDAQQSGSSAERAFREATVGLVTADEFKKAQQHAATAAAEFHSTAATADSKGQSELNRDKDRNKKYEKKKKKETERLRKKNKKMMATLSFAGDDEFLEEEAKGGGECEGENLSSINNNNTNRAISGSMKKNPNVDTSFLPDQEREEKARILRERLKNEWVAEQARIKKEMLEITYSYWDGSGHRRIVRVTKGNTVGDFLEKARRDLALEFREIANLSSDALLYVKEDLIIPQNITFYDLIATRARGKSGPLFNFDVHEDVRMEAIDRRVEKDESHPGKVVERRWYERNKHIFPASRWETFDPTKEYGTYTIHGREVR